MSEGQRRHIPGWLRRLRGWQETPDWLLELIGKEGGFSFVELGARPEEAGFAPTEGLEADDATEESALLEWEHAQPSPEPPALQGDELASEADFPEHEEGAGPAPRPGRSGVTDWLLELEDEEATEEPALPPTEMRERSGWTDEWEELLTETTELGVDPEPGSEEEKSGPPARRSGVTDWLTRLDDEPPEAAGAEAQPSAPAQPAADQDQTVAGDSDDVPDWLSDLEALAPEEGTIEVEGELPPWLADLEAGSPDQETGIPPWLAALEGDQAGKDVPEWLSDLDAGGGIAAWLSEQKEETAPQPEAPDQRAESELPEPPPASFAGLDEAAPEEAGLQEDQLPDWLRDTGETTKDEQAASDAEAGVPDGLAALEGRVPGADETPDWLHDLDEAEGEEPSLPGETAAELGDNDTPDWLRDVVEGEDQEPALSEEGASEPGEAQIPDWLHDLDEAAEEQAPLPEQEPAPSAEAFEELAEDETPDWLRDLAIDEREPEADWAPEAGAPAADWLSLAGAPSGPPAVSEEQEEGEPEERVPPVPEWMEGIYAPREETPAGEEALSLSATEEWPEGEVPEWLAALEEEGTGLTRPGSGIEAGGPLAGLSGVLSPEPILASFPKSTFQPIPPVPDAHQAEAELVERALETPASRRIQVSRASGREILNSLGRWVIYGLLFAAVLIAPLRSCVRLPDLSETRTFYNAIERLPSGSAVLVVFDYDASLDGALTPQARAILWHLQRRDLGIVLLSLTPQGAAIAEDLIAEREGWVAGRDYVALGYLPPHPASLLAFMGNPLGGVARFGTTEDPGETVLGRQIRTFSDLDMVITITGDRDHVRWWIEQVQPRAAIELLAAVPAAITPYVEPYYSELGTGQIAGVLGGLGPTAQYEELIQADFVPSARLSYVVQTNALLLFTGIVLVSGLGSLLGSLSRRSAPAKARGSAGGVE